MAAARWSEVTILCTHPLISHLLLFLFHPNICWCCSKNIFISDFLIRRRLSVIIIFIKENIHLPPVSLNMQSALCASFYSRYLYLYTSPPSGAFRFLLKFSAACRTALAHRIPFADPALLRFVTTNALPVAFHHICMHLRFYCTICTRLTSCEFRLRVCVCCIYSSFLFYILCVFCSVIILSLRLMCFE